MSTRTSSHAQFAQLFRKVLRVLQRRPVVYMGRRTTSTSDPMLCQGETLQGQWSAFAVGPAGPPIPT